MSPKINPEVLITVSGLDSPGITAKLLAVLAESKAEILDMGQAVIHGWLSLSILFKIRTATDGHEKTTIKDLLFTAAELGLKLEFQVFDLKKKKEIAIPVRTNRYAVTLLSNNINAEAIFSVCNLLASFGINIDEIQRLSDESFSCLEFSVSSTNPVNSNELKKKLLETAHKVQTDIAFQSEGIFRKSKRLVVMDMDSTLIRNEVIDEMAKIKGCYKEVSEITEAAMQGKYDFRQSLEKRVKLLDGLDADDFEKVYQQLSITPGSEELIRILKLLGYKTALISGGFMSVAEKLKAKLGIDYVYANTLEMKNGKTTGVVIPPIVDAQRKADILDVIAQQEGISLDQVIAIGDGANDVHMIQKAGLGIAFNAKPMLQDKADLALTQKNLRTILYLLGISDQDLIQIKGM